MCHRVTLPGILVLGRASPINFSVLTAIGLDNKIEHYSTVFTQSEPGTP